MPRPAVVRFGGLAGSLLLAVAAYRSGAGSPWHPTMTPRTVFAGDSGILAPVCWLLGTLAMIGAWWAGRRAIPSARWAYVTAALWVVPLLPLLPLGSYDVYSYACQGWQQATGLDPYGGSVAALGCPWHDAVSPTWLDSPAPYGPVFVVLAAGAVKIGGSLFGTVAVLRILALLGVALTAVCLPVLARRAGVPVERAVWLALACPIVAVHLISGAHNDALMVGLIVAALALLARFRRPIPIVLFGAGVLLGLAVGVKATAVVVVPFALLMAAPPRAALRALLAPALLLAGTVVLTIAAVSAAAGLGLGWIAGLTGSGASVQWTAPSTAVGMTIDLIGGAFGAHWNAVPVTRIAGIAGLVAVLAVLWWRASGGPAGVLPPDEDRRLDPVLAAGLALAATVVLAPVFHPWYATWPLTVLAATLPGRTLWLVAPCAVAAALCLPDGYNLALATKAQGAIAMTVLIVALAVRAVRAARKREWVAT
jgi:alpha-1,6-mannosyltransferase